MRMPRAAFLPIMVLLFTGSTAIAFAQTRLPHDKEFWRSITRNDYRVPEGESPASLIEELSGYLGSPDPELRDEFAYEIPAAWIYTQQLLSKPALHALMARWMSNLRTGVGEIGNDSVLLRSFSALNLSTIAALDNKKPVLEQTDFAALLNAAIEYMNAERDLRGYEPGKGWFHATAHTADLLKFLGRSRYLTDADQGRILDAVKAKLAGGGKVFVFGENDRMAAAVRSLVLRPDFNQRRFEAWLATLPPAWKAMWATPPLDTAKFAELENSKELLRNLVVQLSLIEHPSPAVEDIKTKVLACLAQLN